MAEDAHPARAGGVLDRARSSRGYALVVGVGLLASVAAAVAAGRVWAHGSGDAAGVSVSAAAKGSSSAPLAVALALVALATWGVVLVLRGRARQVAALVGLLASAGVAATTLVSSGRAQRDAVRAVVAKGATGDTSASLSGWFFACAVVAVVALLCFAVAVPAARAWPAMSSRYDAPASRAARPDPSATARGLTEQDMWRAIDDGHDPTS